MMNPIIQRNDFFIMKKLTCDKCNKHLCTVDEMRVSYRKFVELKLGCCKCKHISKFYVPEHLRIIDDGYCYKLISRKKEVKKNESTSDYSIK